MNLISIPKPAVGFHYTGSFQSIAELQTFVTAQGYTVQSMSFNASQDMLFGVNMTLLKQGASTQEQPLYSSLTARPDRYVVSTASATSLLVLTQEQLESDYTVEEPV